MLFKTKSADRPYHYGQYPFEALAKSSEVTTLEAKRPAESQEPPGVTDNVLAGIARKYVDLFLEDGEPEVAPGLSAVPDDPVLRSADVKGFCYFLDASHVGITKVPSSAWLPGKEKLSQQFAVVIAVEDGQMPEPDDLAFGWLDGAAKDISHMRSVEIAQCLANHICRLGYSSSVHSIQSKDIDRDKLAVLSGVAARKNEEIVSPFLATKFTFSVVTTAYPLDIDLPLASAEAADRGLRYWLGINGAMSGRERRQRRSRPLHESRFPVEQLKRVDRPTTLIIDDEVPRVPKRADGFRRAASGDFGKKARAVGLSGLTKSSHNTAMMTLTGGLVPHQDGDVAEHIDPTCHDPQANARAIKSLAYHLGADQVGICKVPDYAWYSHRADGTPITPYHKYAVCILIDQGYDTLEGASGDDWISAAQSMRAYMRGAEMTGIMSEFVRSRGFSARSHTASDGEVLQIPLLLWSGLGELSRIGELVLNPFVGPRFKSVVLTTDIPLAVDKPVDFGLQYFCSNCYKCSRECPCNAMSFGNKVMFNGYEIWKPDVERCVSYRVTNSKGSMCGRCMKMCPLNKIPGKDGPLVHRIGSWLGINAMWLKPLLVPIVVYLDDKLGYGTRNPKKKWWLDLEFIDGVGQKPKATNERDLSLDKPTPPAKHIISYYPANAMPPPDCEDAYPVDRKLGMAMASQLETPDQARERVEAGGAKPLIYVPTPPIHAESELEEEPVEVSSI